MKNMWIACALGALALAACEDGSQGRVNGTVQSALEDGADAPSEDAQVALLWVTQDGNIVAESTPVTGDFPASFSLDISNAPPAEAIQSDADVRGASGMIAVVENDDILGMSEDFVLYLEDAIGAELGAELGVGEVAAGYHLLRFNEDEEATAALDACYDEHAETLYACEDACFANVEPALEGCEDEACFDAQFEAEAECFEGCWSDDPCEDLAGEAFGIEILPIDTPTEVVLFEDFDDEFDDEAELCLDEQWGEIDACYIDCDSLLEGEGDVDEDALIACYDSCDSLVEDAFTACGFDDGFDDDFDDGFDEEAEACLDEQWEAIDACYEGCASEDGDHDPFIECEALFDDEDASDEEIDACFENAVENDPLGQCYGTCDALMEDAFETCGIEYDC